MTLQLLILQFVTLLSLGLSITFGIGTSVIMPIAQQHLPKKLPIRERREFWMKDWPIKISGTFVIVDLIMILAWLMTALFSLDTNTGSPIIAIAIAFISAWNLRDLLSDGTDRYYGGVVAWGHKWYDWVFTIVYNSPIVYTFWVIIELGSS